MCDVVAQLNEQVVVINYLELIVVAFQTIE